MDHGLFFIIKVLRILPFAAIFILLRENYLNPKEKSLNYKI